MNKVATTLICFDPLIINNYYHSHAREKVLNIVYARPQIMTNLHNLLI